MAAPHDAVHRRDTPEVATLCHMQILHITDPHLFARADRKLRGVTTDESLRNVLEEALNRYPDYAAVLVTGDIVQDDPGGYARFRQALGHLQRPVLCIPGNHDSLDAMRSELSAAPFYCCGATQIARWTFIMLDSLEAGYVGGRLAAPELERLERELERARDQHVMIGIHHHPVVMGSEWLDTIGLANKEQFWEIIDAHPQVRSVVWGHVHQEYTGERGSVRLFATPSTGAQFRPGSVEFALDTRPPAYRSFTLYADGRIDTALHWVDAVPQRLTATG